MSKGALGFFSQEIFLTKKEKQSNQTCGQQYLKLHPDGEEEFVICYSCSFTSCCILTFVIQYFYTSLYCGNRDIIIDASRGT